MIDAVRYVVVPVADVACAASFYCDVLEMEVAENEGRGGTRWFAVQPSDDAARLVLFPANPARTGRPAPIFLKTESVQNAYRRLSAADVSCELPRERSGKRTLVIRDPDGNPLVLTE